VLVGAAVFVAAAGVRVIEGVRVSVAGTGVYVGNDGSHVAVAVLVGVRVLVKVGANDENVAEEVSTATFMSVPSIPVKLLAPMLTAPTVPVLIN
jgi:hypothetical protein